MIKAVATLERIFRSAGFTVALLLLYAYFQVVAPLAHLHCNDFKHIYLGMQAIWSHRDPYSAPSLLSVAQDYGLGHEALNPYVYLPFTGIALGFLRPFSFYEASRLWFWLNHILLLDALGLWSHVLELRSERRVSWRLLFNALLLAAAVSHPLSRTLTAGQLNIILLTCYIVSFWFLSRRRDVASGIVLGFAAMFKIAPAIFLLFFTFGRRWRALTAMVASMALLALLSVIIAGWRTHMDFLPVLAQMGYGKSTWQEYGATFWKDPWNQSLNSLFTHLFVEANRVTVSWWEGSQAEANALTWCVVALLLVAYFWAGARLVHHSSHTHQDLSLPLLGHFFQATLLLSLLIPSLLWDHYLVLLLLPFSWFALDAALRRRALTFAAVLVCYVVTAFPMRLDAEVFRHGLGVLGMSAKLYPTLLLYALAISKLASRKTACTEPSSST
jgi:hypothetical protein